jgi:hypothetical protein
MKAVQCTISAVVAGALTAFPLAAGTAQAQREEFLEDRIDAIDEIREELIEELEDLHADIEEYQAMLDDLLDATEEQLMALEAEYNNGNDNPHGRRGFHRGRHFDRWGWGPPRRAFRHDPRGGWRDPHWGWRDPHRGWGHPRHARWHDPWGRRGIRVGRGVGVWW